MEHISAKKTSVFLKRIIAAGTATIMLATSGVLTMPQIKQTVYAAWDGYRDTYSDNSIPLLDFSNFGSVLKTGTIPTEKYSQNGNTYSAHWNNHLVNTDFMFDLDSSVPADWTEYTEINMRIYSEKATNAKLAVIISTSDSNKYFNGSMTVNWDGWKTVKIKTSDCAAVRGATWDNIAQFRLVGHGNWSITGDAETDLYIASVDLKKGDVTSSIDFYSDELIEKTYADLADSFVVYAGGSNVTTSDGAKVIGTEIDYVDGTVMIPARIFEDAFGASVTDDGSSFTIELNDITVSGNADSDTLCATGGCVKIPVNTYSKDSMTFIPGEYLAKIFGKSAYTDGKMLAVGTESAIAAMYRPEGLGVNEENEIASYLAYHTNKSLNDFSKDDSRQVLENYARTLVGDKTTNDMTDPDIEAKVNSFADNADAVWSTLIKEGATSELFMGMNSTESAAMSSAYSKIYTMALGYAAYGSRLYHNAELKNDILYAIEWMYRNRYDQQYITGWNFSGFNNWWDWDIGSPMSLIPTLVLMREDLTAKQLDTYLAYFDMRNPMPSNGASNFVELARFIMISSLLQDDYQRAIASQTALHKMYLYSDDMVRFAGAKLTGTPFRESLVPIAEGFYTDGSYVAHARHAQNGNYGGTHFTALAQIEKVYGGTAFEMDTPFRDHLPEFFLEGFDPLIYGTTFFRHAKGRVPEGDVSKAGLSYLCTAFSIADKYPEDIRNKIYAVVKSAYLSNPDAGFESALGIDDIKRFKQVMADDSIEPLKTQNNNKVYYYMDKVVHKTDEWAAGISMSSARIFSWESINNQNMSGWYLGDGRTEYYLWGNKMNADADYWSSLDPYRLPGTTVDTQPRKAVSIDGNNEWLSTKDFVGGVSHNKTYGVAAMELESYHLDEDIGIDGGNHGGAAPAHQNDLTAKKSYFMFDDELVCLGAAVNAKNNNNAEVLTVVDSVMADDVKILSGEVRPDPYHVTNVVASMTPEAANVASNTIDDDSSSKWAAEYGAEIVWDLGSAQKLGFVTFAFQNGSKRQQMFELLISEDGDNWQSVFDGASSGEKENNESFALGGETGRYLKFVNKGNNGGSAWVSICDCKIYPENADGSVGFKEASAVGTDRIVADDKEITVTNSDYSLAGVNWVNANGKCGYVFPDENLDNSGNLKCRWTSDMNSHFEIWFSHGTNPTDGSYSYILLPGKSEEFTKQYAQSRKVEILSNTPKLQAVADNSLGTTGIVFWEKGSYDKISVNVPCILMYSETDEEFRISVSDPTQKLSSAKIIIDRELTCLDSDECASSKTEGGKTILTLNMKDSGGRSMEAVYAK